MRNGLRLFTFAALAVLVSLPVGADEIVNRSPEKSIDAGGGAGLRRRAVRRPPPTQGRCVTFGSIRPGLVADYVATTTQGNVNFQVTYVSDSPTRTVTEQEVQAPSGNASVDTIIDYEIVSGSSGPQRAVKLIDLTATTTPFPGLNFVIETEISHVPSLVIGPGAEWCQGDVWLVPATTQTTKVTTNGGTPSTTVTTTLQTGGEVLSVGEMVTTPAGTFETLKYIGITLGATGGERARVWLSLENGIAVRQESLDSANNVTSTVELVDLQ